ncbi:MAG: ExbD/TolR family protein [Flavobacteriaceae bacterium]|jgi:biopolymer transport protein ExbD
MKIQRKNLINPQFNMSSMTDVVFLLLIFFLLTSNVPKALDLITPTAEGNQTKAADPNMVTVSIDKSLNWFIDGEQISSEYLEVELDKVLEKIETPTIILYADENIPLKESVKVMNLANKKNYKLILAVQPEG